jgi:hypothetical protein
LKAVDGEFGVLTVLDGGKIEAIDNAKKPLDTITFYPTGRVQPAQVTITADDGEAVAIACNAPAEDFAIVDQK